MIKRLKANKTLWLLVACLSLIAAFIGVFDQNIYSKVVSRDLLPTIVTQDAITTIAGLVLMFLSLKINEADKKSQRRDDDYPRKKERSFDRPYFAALTSRSVQSPVPSRGRERAIRSVA
jgi:hypothetical protein